VPPIQIGAAIVPGQAPAKPAARDAALYIETPKPAAPATPQPVKPAASTSANTSVSAPKAVAATTNPSMPNGPQN